MNERNPSLNLLERVFLTLKGHSYIPEGMSFYHYPRGRDLACHSSHHHASFWRLFKVNYSGVNILHSFKSPWNFLSLDLLSSWIKTIPKRADCIMVFLVTPWFWWNDAMIIRREHIQTTHVLFQEEWYPSTGPTYTCSIHKHDYGSSLQRRHWLFSYHVCEQINMVLTVPLNSKHRVNHVHWIYTMFVTLVSFQKRSKTTMKEL